MTSAPDLETYRRHAREWLSANLERRDTATPMHLRGGEHHTREDLIPERALQKKLYAAGYAGITWPKEYGGQGLTPEHQRVFAEESRPFRTPDFGHAGSSFGPCGETIIRHASAEFLERHVPKMLAGDELFVQFFSEPSAGSDLAGIMTRAVKDGDRWILTGSKIWTSGAFYADYGMCLARTDWDVPKHRGLTWFAVPVTAKGVTVQPIKEINGEAEFCQEFFDEVEVPENEVIGEVNGGWTVTQTMLLFERSAGQDDPSRVLNVSAGIDPFLVDMAARVGRLQDPLARQLLAQTHVIDWVRLQLGRRIPAMIRKGDRPANGIASYWKLAAGTYEPVRARLVMELSNGAALTWHADAGLDERRPSLDYLNSRVWSIAGGSNEMQRNGISERVLGLPREPSYDTDKPFSEVIRNAQHWSGKPE
jgi:alkylation response protein AidB-like acyl-CoA dehydrogenase